MSSEYKRVRDYELMVIFHPELSEEDLVNEIGKVESHITAGEGTITLINRETPWGRRRLSYAIRHDSRDIRDGFYVLYYFTAEASTLVNMEREIKLQDRILRYLMTQQIAPIMEPVVEEETAEGETADTPAESVAVAEVVAVEEALAEAVVEEAVAEAVVEEVVAEAVVEEAVAETVGEEVVAEAVIEEAVAEAVVEEAVAEADSTDDVDAETEAKA